MLSPESCVPNDYQTPGNRYYITIFRLSEQQFSVCIGDYYRPETASRRRIAFA